MNKPTPEQTAAKILAMIDGADDPLAVEVAVLRLMSRQWSAVADDGIESAIEVSEHLLSAAAAVAEHC